MPVLADDTADTLAKRVHAQEHIIYPLVVKWFSEQRLTMEADYAVLDEKPIILISTDQVAEVAELVDAPDLGSGAARCESSSLSFRTILGRSFKMAT